MRGDSLQLEQKLGQTQKMEAIERLAGGIAHDRDAMPRGGVLSIETAKVELDRAYVDDHPGSTAGPHVMPAISDTGVGMDPAVQEHLFEPFYTTKEPGKGTGLGLATVYGIVNQSGGSILVHSEADRGTSVKVFLPRVAPAAEISAGPVEIPAGLRGGETILLVEDQQEVRAVVQHMLGRHGYIDLAASHGNDALAAAREHQGDIDLLIADVVMPGMNGRDLVGQFLRELPDAQVLYMSGYTDDGVVLQGIVEQTVAFIQKPFTPATLLQKVREILDAENPGGASS
jgi:CheY-like chemotaxis protein